MNGTNKTTDILTNYALLDSLLQSFQAVYKTLVLPTLTFSEAIAVLPPGSGELIKAVYALPPNVVEAQDLTEHPAKLFVAPNKSVYAQRFVRVTPPLLESFEKLQKQLKKQTDHHLKIISGYRSPTYQAILLLGDYSRNGYDMAATLRTYMPPGYSQHGKVDGLAIDVGHSYELDEAFEDTISYRWMQAHASVYGFRLTYPKSQNSMIFEPWHYVYKKT